MRADECYNMLDLDEVTQVLKLYSRNLFVILSLFTPHSLSFSTKQRHFIKKTVCIQAHVDFISDCLTFRFCTPVWWWEDRWVCLLYLSPAVPNLQTSIQTISPSTDILCPRVIFFLHIKRQTSTEHQLHHTWLHHENPKQCCFWTEQMHFSALPRRQSSHLLRETRSWIQISCQRHILCIHNSPWQSMESQSNN